ncbi:MAG: hypothetical protein EHM48_02620 [Planctomycetaceae bacterium]|nr:MAG: hypothetical protein EHM48_02620 [Planctomycetaceae bacterium]
MELMPPFLLLKIVYDDDDLIEIESRLVVGDWSGRSLAYASAMLAKENAESLAKWILKTNSPFVLELGGNDATGWVCLRFRKVDNAGHILCYIQLADRDMNQRAGGEVSRLAIEMQVDLGQIERFALALKTAVSAHRGEALLQGRIR